MRSGWLWGTFDRSAGLLVDTNLLVLYIVGSVNRERITGFKRTRTYTKEDYDLLIRLVSSFQPLHTVAHVLAEVSNLTDLSGPERRQALLLLRHTISSLTEAEMPSTRAAESRSYERLGLTDAAIVMAAREHRCTVLTDDLDLYVALYHAGIKAINFSHLREGAWGSV